MSGLGAVVRYYEQTLIWGSKQTLIWRLVLAQQTLT